MSTSFTLKQKVLSAREAGIKGLLNGKFVRTAFLVGMLLTSGLTGYSQTFTTISTDVTGDNVTDLLDAESFSYYYQYEVDSLFFRVSVAHLDTLSDTLGMQVRAQIPGDASLESWGNWQGGGVVDDSTFNLNRLITAWLEGTPPSTYTGTMGIADSAGVAVANYTNLFANNLSVDVDTVNEWITLGMLRTNFVTNAQLNDTVRDIPAGASVDDTQMWSDDVFGLPGVVTIAPAPGLVAPANGAGGLPIAAVELDWDTVAGSSDYIYQYSTDPTFATGVVTGTSVDTKETITGLTLYTTYNWRVQTVDGTDTSTYSPVFAFITQLDTPSLILPLNGETGIPIAGPTLTWDSIFGTVNYVVEYSTDITFATNTVTDIIAAPDTTDPIVGLNYFTTYYWRVRATDNIDTSAYSPTWSFLTDPAPPTLINPVNMAEAIPVSGQQLDWSIVTGATDYWFQYADNPAFMPLWNEGTITDTFHVVPVANQLFHNDDVFWRVMAINATDSSDWSTVWQFKTELDTLILASPPNGATVATIDTTLTWDAVPGATSYEVEYSTDITFASGVVNNIVTGLNLQIGGLANSTTYYWRARARNNPNLGEWSPTWSFNSGIDIPNLISPPDQSINIPVLGLVLAWTSVSGATNYDFEYSIDSTFQTNVLGGNETTTTTTLPELDHNLTYFWRVRSDDGTSTSPWSNVWRFLTENLAIPNHVSPPTGTPNVPMSTTTIIWDPVFGATEYILNYGRDQTFLNEVNVVNVNATSTDISDLFGDSQYFWRVRATDGGTFSDWSVPWNFTTGIDAPFLISPDSNAINVGNNELNTGTFSVPLLWESVKGAVKYELNVSEEDSFDPLLYDVTTFTNSFTLSGLESFSTFFWRVRTLGPNLTSEWSVVWNFSTALDVTGVSVPVTGNPFSVFPNPSDGLYRIKFNGNLSQQASLRVVNAMGQVVESASIQGNVESVLDLRDWDSGFYTLIIEDGETTHTSKLIKH